MASMKQTATWKPSWLITLVEICQRNVKGLSPPSFSSDKIHLSAYVRQIPGLVLSSLHCLVSLVSLMSLMSLVAPSAWCRVMGHGTLSHVMSHSLMETWDIPGLPLLIVTRVLHDQKQSRETQNFRTHQLQLHSDLETRHGDSSESRCLRVVWSEGWVSQEL